MDITTVQNLVLQNVETLRRAAERSVRGLRKPGQDGEIRQSHAAAVREFAADSRDDLQSLHMLRKTADDLMRDGIEAEAFQHFCEVALEAAEITMKGSAAAENSEPELIGVDPEGGKLLMLQIKENSKQAHATHAYFHRLVEWLRIPLQPLPQSVLDKLDSLPSITGPDNAGRGNGTLHNSAADDA
jgi:hypothetical protein